MGFLIIEDEAREILKHDEQARGDDMALYASYVYSHVSNAGLGMGWLQRVFSDRRFRITHGIAPYDSISRVRRRLQEKDPTLRPDADFIAARKKEERKYKAYAKGVKVFK